MATKESPASKKAKTDGEAQPKTHSGQQLTVEQLESDEISQLAAVHWRSSDPKPFNPQV